MEDAGRYRCYSTLEGHKPIYSRYAMLNVTGRFCFDMLSNIYKNEAIRNNHSY